MSRTSGREGRQAGPPTTERLVLRREPYEMNRRPGDLLDEVIDDRDAASAVRAARRGLFDAWTALCIPPDDEED